jgi:hypothetical protein
VELSEWGGAPQSDDDTMADDNPLKRFLELLSEAMAKAGKPFPERSDLVERLRKYIRRFPPFFLASSAPTYSKTFFARDVG